jgi:3-hydroxybutyrate dehydrogenase
MSALLKNKIALITGSTSGIGWGVATSLAREGCHIALNGLATAEQAQTLQNTLEKEFNVRTFFSPADMSSPAAIRQMFADIKKHLGDVDILVNNAGIQHVAEIENFPAEKWDAILAINLSSAFHTVQAALPEMKKKNWGRIINIASVHGLVASAQKVAYVAAKHGIVGLTKTVALETARTGITCNAICPGWVLTPLVQKQIDDQAAKLGLSETESRQKLLSEKQPSLEFVTPEQIGDTVAFLCSPTAQQIRGVALNMDGGWLAQ